MIMRYSRRTFLASTLALTACTPKSSLILDGKEKFICPPCGCSVDHVEFDDPGPCPECGMPLAPKFEENLGFKPARLSARAGSFELPGGIGHQNARIQIHYYLPDGFTENSNILLIIPGAGRNSADYRNAWLATARDKNVLIAALGYAEKDYDFAAYHMAGLIKNLEFRSEPTESTTQGGRVIRMNDEDIVFDNNPNSAQWLFNDFDRIFAHIVSMSGSSQHEYDLFGHSAGGQILHRLALLQATSRAERIVAANSGFYTLPDLRKPLITGLKGSGMTSEMLIHALGKNLTLLLGELDNGDGAGGTLLHTPAVDEQGLGRLSRGQHFFALGEAQAERLRIPFGWALKTVPGVGHNYQGMSRAAADVLY